MNDKKIIIVIPTYNERGNLPLLLEQLKNLSLPLWQVVLVDDNSPDGTGKLADELSHVYPLEVIHRDSKQGLGPAYIAGFTHALDLDGSYIVQMDADLSHDAAVIPRMIELLADVDWVIGARYIDGGGSEGWSKMRNFISWFANTVVKVLLRSKLHDLTSGFKAFRVDTLRSLPFEDIASTGYNFQIDVNILLERKGLRCMELPIIFTERQSGKSKFDLKIMIESAVQVFIRAVKRERHE